MRTLSVSTDSIEIGERHRSLNEDACARLMSSMKEIGLKQPISIRVVDLMVIDGQEVEGVPVLVAGRHRLEAARRLGWSHIECFEVDDDPVSAELWEIAENLHRCDLSKEQRDHHIRRYAELMAAREAAYLISRQNDTKLKTPDHPKGAGRPKGIAAKIAAETGLSKTTVLRALAPRPAPPTTPRQQDAPGKQLDALKKAWREASPEVRRAFLDSIERIAA